MNGIDWSLLLGVLTLVCWLGAGLTTLFGTTHAIRYGDIGRTNEAVTFALSCAGVVFAVLLVTEIALL